MHRPEFSALERALVAADVAPRVVCRMLQELNDHCDDIAADAVARGMPADEAPRYARATIGSDESIVRAITARSELMCWYCRWPRCATLLYRLVCYVSLPIAPVSYCAHHGGTIARWSASAGLGALVTGALLFTMQLALR